MFAISRIFNLDICAPSFSENSKLSHFITIHKPNILLTYTNFVEVNTPLFNRKALDNLMVKLNYELIGWGIDYLYIICNGICNRRSYAIIHKVVCKKKNGQELSKIKNFNNLQKEIIYNLYSTNLIQYI